MFYQLILTVAVLGLVVNLVALFIIGRKKHRTMFHDLLIILTISDVAVVICCALQFALPSLWEAYSSKAYPHILQFLLPVMHITVMISVYTTILISFERFVRICFYCQLRETSILSEENIKFYKLFVILFPVIFYIPKFFEVRSHHEVIETQIEVDCHKYILLASYLENPFLRSYFVKELTQSEIEKTERLSKACSQLVSNQTGLVADKKNLSYTNSKPKATNESRSTDKTKTRFEGQKLTTRLDSSVVSDQVKHRRRRKYVNDETTTPMTTIGQENTSETSKLEENLKTTKPQNITRQTMFRNITTSKKISLKVIPTTLRKNEYYYKIYYVYLNTIFASILPLALLLFLNISTAIELIKMSRQESQILARNTSIVVMPPRITMSECSDQRLTRAQSMPRVTEPEEGENVKALRPLMSNSHGQSGLESPPRSDELTRNSTPNALSPNKETQNSTDKNHQKQNNNIYNSERTQLSSPDHLEVVGAASNDIQVEGASCMPSPLNGSSSRNESRRSTITYDFADSVKKSPSTSTGILAASKAMDPEKSPSSNNYGTRFRESRRRRSCRRASSVFNQLVGRDNGRLSEATIVSHGPSIREKKKELRLVRISLCIVWLFIFCHIWKLIPTFYTTFISEDTNVGFDVVWPDWLTIIDRISTTFITLNSSLNFLIYVVV